VDWATLGLASNDLRPKTFSCYGKWRQTEELSDFRRQLFRVTYRMTRKPVLPGGIALLLGYVWAALRRVDRVVSPELMRFHRHEQMKKLRAIFRTLLRLEKVDSFRVAIER